MKKLSSQIRLVPRGAIVTAAFVLLGVARAPAAERVLYSFTGGTDGGGPNGGLVFDSSGNLFGTTHFGGITSCGGNVGGGCGVVFELSLSGRKWVETPLYAFADGADGGFPNSGVLDAGGNLLGSASTGGSNACSIGCGVAYELAPASGKWTEYVLHAFAGPDGQFPNASLLPVGPITLFSTTVSGGTNGSGAVFELQSTPLDDGWQETVLYSFTGKGDGSAPYSGVARDTKGNLYGTTYPSDAYNGGVTYELTLGKAGTWKEQVLHAFGIGKDGSNPDMASSSMRMATSSVRPSTAARTDSVGSSTSCRALDPRHGPKRSCTISAAPAMAASPTAVWWRTRWGTCTGRRSSAAHSTAERSSS